jgi:hypothetical protein
MNLILYKKPALLSIASIIFALSAQYYKIKKFFVMEMLILKKNWVV